MTIQINQLASCIAFPDAVSNHVLTLDKYFQTQGYTTKIFATSHDPALQAKNIHPIEDFPKHARPKDSKTQVINILHYSIHDKTSDYFLNAPGKKVFIYHNITPAKFFRGYNEDLAYKCKQGRQALTKFKNSDYSIALSDYSQEELLQKGFPKSKIQTIPYPILPHPPFSTSQNSHNLNKSPNLHSPNLIFIGKIAPHKKVEDSIKAFYLFQKYYQPHSHLHIVGLLGNDLYEHEIKSLIAKLDLNSHITLHGKVTEEQKHQLLQSATAFITMSEHEGFCVPLIEAMQHKIPIIAYQSSAITGTLGQSGIQIPQKDYGLIAEAINLTITNPSVRQKIIKDQLDQLQKFNQATVLASVDRILKSLV